MNFPREKSPSAELFDLDVDVEFRSGVYIKADGYAARNLATTGMQDSDLPLDYGQSDDATETATIMQKIKAVLGL